MVDNPQIFQPTILFITTIKNINNNKSDNNIINIRGLENFILKILELYVQLMYK